MSRGIAIYGLFLRLFGVTGWREAVNAIRQTTASDLRDYARVAWTAQAPLANDGAEAGNAREADNGNG